MDEHEQRQGSNLPKSSLGGVPGGERFPSRLRLGHRREFDRVFQHKCSVAEGSLVLYGLSNELTFPRLGLSVGRRIGNAVRRNRWKRALREAFRRQRGSLPSGIDMVVVVRGLQPPEAEQVSAQLKALAWRLARRLERRR